MNMLAKQSSRTEGSMDLDLNCLLEKTLPKSDDAKDEDTKPDDVLVNIAEEITPNSIEKVEVALITSRESAKETVPDDKVQKKDMKIADIFVQLENIRPSSIPPLTVLDEKNGITVTLHFAKDKPRDDINVIVVTSISKNELPLSSYLFQAVVPKVG